MFRFRVLLIILMLARSVSAKKSTFSWLHNTETDLAGYKLYIGTSSRNYNITKDVALPPIENGRVTVKLQPYEGEHYYAVTAYNTSGQESDYSDEIKFIYIPIPKMRLIYED